MKGPGLTADCTHHRMSTHISACLYTTASIEHSIGALHRMFHVHTQASEAPPRTAPPSALRPALPTGRACRAAEHPLPMVARSAMPTARMAARCCRPMTLTTSEAVPPRAGATQTVSPTTASPPVGQGMPRRPSAGGKTAPPCRTRVHICKGPTAKPAGALLEGGRLRHPSADGALPAPMPLLLTACRHRRWHAYRACIETCPI